MKRVAEIIHIVEEQREEFIYSATHPSEETKEILWLCGVRKQQYFQLNEYIIMTFEYGGKDFANDMAKMAAHLEKEGHLIKQRRKDVAPDKRSTQNWWAPLKRLGSVLESKPAFEGEKSGVDYTTMLDGYMDESISNNNISYDENDWVDDFHF